MEGNGSKISVFISFIEIYQEQVRDLGKAVSRLHETGGHNVSMPFTRAHCLGVQLAMCIQQRTVKGIANLWIASESGKC